jgi:hypothetical protein
MGRKYRRAYGREANTITGPYRVVRVSAEINGSNISEIDIL